MSEAGSAGHASQHSSLRGWAQTGLGVSARPAHGRDELDVTRSSLRSQESLNSATGLRGGLQFGPSQAASQGAQTSDFFNPTSARPASTPLLTGLGSATFGAPRSSQQDAASPSDASDKEKERQLADQLKQERSWWSVHMMGETHEMEKTVKQELHRTTMAMRDKFAKELEGQRNDYVQRTAHLERSISNLASQIDQLRNRSDGPSTSSTSSASVQQLKVQVTDLDRSLRLELSRVSAAVEDAQRLQTEVMTSLSAQQAALQAEHGASNQLRTEVEILQEKLRTEEQRRDAQPNIDSSALERLQSQLQTEVLALLGEERHSRRKELDELREESKRQTKDLLDQTLLSKPKSDDVSRAQVSSLEGTAHAAMQKVDELSRKLAEEIASCKMEIGFLRNDMGREHQSLTTNLDGTRDAFEGEIRRLKSELETANTAAAAASAKATAATVAATAAAASASASESGAVPAAGAGPAVTMEAEMRFSEIEGSIEEAKKAWKSEFESLKEVTTREVKEGLAAGAEKNASEVTELRNQLFAVKCGVEQRAACADLQEESVNKSLSSLDSRIQKLASETEIDKLSRAADAERSEHGIQALTAALQKESSTRNDELEKCRKALANLAISVQSGKGGNSATTAAPASEGELMSALQSLLDGTGVPQDVNNSSRSIGSEKMQSQVSTGSATGKSSTAAPEVATLISKLGSLRTEFRAELTREAKNIISILRHDMKAMELRVTSGQGSGSSSGAGGLDSLPMDKKVAALGQLNEVCRVVKILTTSCESLGERLTSESAQRRAADSALDVRIVGVEKRLVSAFGEAPALDQAAYEEIKAAQESEGVSRDPNQPQALELLQKEANLSDRLKVSFEHMMGRISKGGFDELGLGTPGSSKYGGHGASTPNDEHMHPGFSLNSSKLRQTSAEGVAPNMAGLASAGGGGGGGQGLRTPHTAYSSHLLPPGAGAGAAASLNGDRASVTSEARPRQAGSALLPNQSLRRKSPERQRSALDVRSDKLHQQENEAQGFAASAVAAAIDSLNGTNHDDAFGASMAALQELEHENAALRGAIVGLPSSRPGPGSVVTGGGGSVSGYGHGGPATTGPGMGMGMGMGGGGGGGGGSPTMGQQRGSRASSQVVPSASINLSNNHTSPRQPGTGPTSQHHQQHQQQQQQQQKQTPQISPQPSPTGMPRHSSSMLSGAVGSGSRPSTQQTSVAGSFAGNRGSPAPQPQRVVAKAGANGVYMLPAGARGPRPNLVQVRPTQPGYPTALGSR